MSILGKQISNFKNSLSSSQFSEVDSMVNGFKRLSVPQQQYALISILDHCLPEQHHFVIEYSNLTLNKTDYFSAPWFSDECRQRIFGYLNARELSLVSGVGSRWNRISQRETLWKRLCIREFGYAIRNPPQRLLLEISRDDWKKNYQLLSSMSKPLVQLAGDSASAVIGEDGLMYVWGKFQDGNESYIVAPTANTFDSPVISASFGESHFCCVTEEGDLYTWGMGSYGRLGHGNTENVLEPKRVTGFEGMNVVHASVGYAYCAAITESGALYTWGPGVNYEEGYKATPDLVEFFRNYKIANVSCRGGHLIVLTACSKVFTWGWKINSSDPVDHPVEIEMFRKKKIVDVNAGFMHFGAISASGTLYTWGCGDNGRLGHGDRKDILTPKKVAALRKCKVVCVSCGAFHSVAVTDTGAAYTFGKSFYGGKHEVQYFPTFLYEIEREWVVAASAGSYHTILVTEDGKVLVWGKGGGGRLPFEGNSDVHEPIETNILGQVSALSKVIVR